MAQFVKRTKGRQRRARALVTRLRIIEDITRRQPLINLIAEATAGRPSSKHPTWKVRSRTALENATIYRKWLEDKRLRAIKKTDVDQITKTVEPERRAAKQRREAIKAWANKTGSLMAQNAQKRITNADLIDTGQLRISLTHKTENV